MTENDDATPFAWSDLFLMGYAPLNDEHREFVAVVSAMLACHDGQMATFRGDGPVIDLDAIIQGLDLT
jgi:hypothetical protein